MGSAPLQSKLIVGVPWTGRVRVSRPRLTLGESRVNPPIVTTMLFPVHDLKPRQSEDKTDG